MVAGHMSSSDRDRRRSPSPSKGSRTYTGPIVDCDVHHSWPSQEVMMPYLSPAWREYVRGQGHGRLLPVYEPSSFPISHNTTREDTWPDSGVRPGSDYDTMRRQLLDPLNIYKAVLTFDDV